MIFGIGWCAVFVIRLCINRVFELVGKTFVIGGKELVAWLDLVEHSVPWNRGSSILNQTLVWAHGEVAMVQDKPESTVCLVFLEEGAEFLDEAVPIFNIKHLTRLGEHG